MRRTLFTADPHFFHANIVGHCRRPFGSVEGMNAQLVEWWNEVVTSRDVVYVLGDLSWPVIRERMRNLIGSLHGKIILVPAIDHDRRILGKLDGLVEIEKPLVLLNLPEGERAVLCHYPLASWTGSHYGVYMLHGHCHGRLRPGFFPRRCDVGMDAWNYRPVTFEQVKARVAEEVTRREEGERPS